MRALKNISKSDQPIRIGKRQRTEQYPFDDRKNRRRRADSQRKHQDGGNGKSRRLTQLAEGISDVL